MKRDAFTMIELIFVIVILGILAAVAIPKLAATRDDAKIATECTNISACVTDVAAEYTASETTLSVTTSPACVAATNSGASFIILANDIVVTGNLCTRLDGSTRFKGRQISI